MAVAILEEEVKRKTERTEIIVPHLGGTLRFAPHLFGPDYYTHVMEKIDSQNLIRPTTAEVLSFTDFALQHPDEVYYSGVLEKFRQRQLYIWRNNPDPHILELKRRFRQGYLWTCTESWLFEDKKGRIEMVLVVDRKNDTIPKTSKQLFEFCYDKDKNKDNLVRPVESGFEKGPMSISDYLKNPYLIAQIGGEEMLETAERVAKACSEKEVYLYGPDSIKYHKKGLTILFQGCENDNKFYLNGGLNSVSYEGFSPAIRKVA